MGIHICIVKDTYTDHPDWDSLRYAEDTRFHREILTKIFEEERDRAGYQIEEFRPQDFERWRKAAEGYENAERYKLFFDLLEADPEYFIHISY